MLFLWIVFLALSTSFSFSWNPAPASVDILVSPNPACLGNYDLTIGGTLYPCFGTGVGNVVTEQSCPNGLHGIMINDTLTCGVITEYIAAGQEGCVNGGYRFLSNTQNFTQCYGLQAYVVNSTANGIPIIYSTSAFQTILKSFGNSSSVFFYADANNVFALIDYVVSSSGVGGASIVSASTGQTLTLKEFFGVGGITISTNTSGIYVTAPTLTNSSSVNFIQSGASVSANALVTASDATSGGKTAISSYAANNIVFKQFFDDPTGVIQFSQTSSSINVLSLLTAYNLNYTGFNPSLFTDCPGITKASDVFVCLAQRTIGFVNNATSAGLVIYTPAIPFKNQTSFSVAQGFDYIFEDQSSATTRIIYVNGQIGDDTVNSGGQFDPFKTIDKAVSAVPVVLFTQFYTILVSIDIYNVGNISFPPNTNLISYNRFKQTHLNFCSGCKITLGSSWSTFVNDHVEAGISGFTLNGDVDIDFTTMGAAGINSDARFSFSETSILGSVQSHGRGNTDLFHVHNIEMHGGFNGNCQNIHAEYSSSLSSITLNDDNCYSNLTYLVIYNVFGDNSNLTLIQNTSDVHADIFTNAYDDGAWMVLRGGSQLHVITYTIPLNYDADPNVTIIFTFNSQGGRSCGLNTAYFPFACMNNADILITIRLRARLAITSGAGGVSAIFNTTIPNVIFNEFASLTDMFSVAASGTGLVYYNINVFNTSNADCPAGSFRLGTVGGYEACKPFAFTPANLGMSFTTDNFLNFVESGGGLDYIVSFIGQLTFNDSTYFSVFKNPLGTFQVFYRNPLRDITLTAGSSNVVVTSGSGIANFTVDVSLNPLFTTVSTGSGFIAKNGTTTCYFNSAGTFSNCFSAASGLAANLNLNWPTTAGTQGDILVKGAGNQASWSSSAITLTPGSGISASAGSGSNNYTIANTGVLSTTAGTNIVQTGTAANPTISTSLTPSFTTATATGSVILPSGASVKFNDTTNNATITMTAPAGLTQSYDYALPTTPGTSGQVLQANGDGSTQWIGIRRRIFESCANGTANLGISSTAFNTMLAGTACATGPASKFIAANTINVGTVFDMIVGGILSRAGSATIQTRILVNSTAAVTSVAADTGAARTNVGFTATARCLFQTIGVSGSVLCSGTFLHDQMLSVQVLSTLVPITVDTTSVLFFGMELAFSSSASNMFTSGVTAMYIAL